MKFARTSLVFSLSSGQAGCPEVKESLSSTRSKQRILKMAQNFKMRRALLIDVRDIYIILVITCNCLQSRRHISFAAGQAAALHWMEAT